MGAKCQRELYRNWGRIVRSESFRWIGRVCDVIRTCVPERVWHTFCNLNNFLPVWGISDFLFDLSCMGQGEQVDVLQVGPSCVWRHRWCARYGPKRPVSMAHISKVVQDIEKVWRPFNTNMGWISHCEWNRCCTCASFVPSDMCQNLWQNFTFVPITPELHGVSRKFFLVHIEHHIGYVCAKFGVSIYYTLRDTADFRFVYHQFWLRPIGFRPILDWSIGLSLYVGYVCM